MSRGTGSARLGWRTRWSIRLARARRWEFWPGSVFYAPVIVYIVIRGLVTGALTRFTAVNPGISHAGGLIGEAKHETLVPLADAHPDFVAPFLRLSADLPTDARIEQALEFGGRQPAAWPLVIKPDHGERGRGVRIAKSPQAVVDYFQRLPVDVLVQAYVPGEEFGLFYVRRPGQAGVVTSIVEKQFPSLTADGRRSLADLILAHPRARLIAPMLFDRLGEALDTVPAAGTVIPIADVGSHCRGAVFVDASNRITDALTHRVRALADAIPGFYFGRFDVRAVSADALERGQGFRVVEVNGASAEPAHVYQPGTPLWRGVTTFCATWRDMYRIGVANVRSGAPWVRPLALATMTWRVHRAAKVRDWPENVWPGDRTRYPDC